MVICRDSRKLDVQGLAMTPDTQIDGFQRTSCARHAPIQVVVSVNSKAQIPDTTVKFTSPIEAGSLLVESGVRFKGQVHVDLALVIV